MAAIGPGVIIDASATKLRFTWYDQSHADFQDDGNGNFEMDLHKIWACMGRNDANGNLRSGLVETGNPFTGAARCFIEPQAGGVLGGANVWNTNTAYSPTGGIAVNDDCRFGCLDVPRGVAFHLDTPLAGQPTFVLEQLVALNAGNYGAGATWSDITSRITLTPDFTQANGKALQRLEFDPPTTWGPLQPADAIGGGGALTSPYYIFRIRLTGVIPAAPIANINYRDWLYGYFKRFYSEYALKHMDDGAGTLASSFRDPGLWSLEFRTGMGFQSDVQSTCFFQIGELGTNLRPTPKFPWVVTGDTAHTLNSIKAYGGSIICRGKYKGSGGGQPLIRGRLSDGELVDMRLWGMFGNFTLGSGGASFPMKILDWLRVTPDYDNVAASVGIFGQFSLSSDGYSRDLMIDGRRGGSLLHGVRTSIASARFYGLIFSDDDFSDGQIYTSGSGNKEAYGVSWGGPNNKAGGVPPLRDRRKLRLYVFRNGDSVPIQGIRVQGYDIFANTQIDGVSDGTGLVTWVGWNALLESNSRDSVVVSMRTSDPGDMVDVDTYMLIVVNDPNAPQYQESFQTLTIYMKMGRAFLYDNATGDYGYADWQPANDTMYVTLPEVVTVPGGGAVGPYTRKVVPATPYTPKAQASTPFSRLVVPATPYSRAPVPGSIFSPCPIPDGVTYSPRSVPATTFRRTPVPSVDYRECGTPPPDTFMLFGPFFAVKVTGGS